MRFLIVTGLSGAGKTCVIKHLEDSGYQCMDNLPPLLLEQTLRLCEKVELPQSVALGIDSRSGAMFNAEAVIDALTASADSHDISMLFLEADTETLIDRYKETRRDHPLMKDGKTLEECIAHEREMLQPLREHAHYILSTAGMKAKEIRTAVDEIIAQGQQNHQTLRTEIMSFGYKRGIPRESDLVFDVRFLPNPFYMEELCRHTGLDEDVRTFVMEHPVTQEFMAKVRDMLLFLLPHYQEEGKHRLVIAVGCTGGAHRSVAIAEAIADLLRQQHYQVDVSHRDIDLEQAHWKMTE